MEDLTEYLREEVLIAQAITEAYAIVVDDPEGPTNREIKSGSMPATYNMPALLGSSTTSTWDPSSSPVPPETHLW